MPAKLSCVIVEDQTMFLQLLHNMLQATARTKAEAIAACERAMQLAPSNSPSAPATA